MISMGSVDTPTPTPPSPMGEGEGMSTGGGGGDDFEDVSSVDIMHTLIKACHWLFDNAEEPWIMGDDKSIIATSSTLHSPTCPIGLPMESEWTLLGVPVPVQSKWSPSGVHSD